jgi:FkbM family methyltransferase
MKVVCTPGDFPSGVSYTIFGAGPRSLHLQRLLQVLRPDAICLGLQTAPGPFGDRGDTHAVVLVDADWAAVADRLRAAGCADQRIVLFPVTEQDLWGYWDFSRLFIDQIVREDNQVPFRSDAFIRYLLQIDHLSLANGEVKVNTLAYAGLMQDAVAPHREKIALVRDHVSNHASRDVLDRIFQEGPRGQWHYYWGHCFEHLQYFDYVSIRPGDVIINGGVSGGYEIPVLLAHLQGQGQIHNVDPLGFDYLSDYARPSMEHFASNVFQHRLAFADRRGTLSLPVSTDAGGAQAIGKLRDQTLENCPTQDFPCLTIDQFVTDQRLDRVDLIKLDLEGAEEYVLDGTMETINRFRPQLAVSIYHKVDHIWDLPIFLMSRLPEYHFFIDIYSFERFEIILYCVPFERPVRRCGPVEIASPT